MKKHIDIICFVIIMFILTGCPGAIDSIAWKELGNGYIYHEPAGMPSIGKESGDKGIPGLVFAYRYNRQFIIVLEKDVKLSEEKKDELITSGDFYDFVKKKGASRYWIIVHLNDSIYGPFTKEKYLQKREELGVPKELQLNN